VFVRLTAQGDQRKLIIEDDGCGFPFSGRLSQSELDKSNHGPTVLMERVRAIGGELTIESAPGRGARVEITLPS
jgi:signal transduction histidine kinase